MTPIHPKPPPKHLPYLTTLRLIIAAHLLVSALPIQLIPLSNLTPAYVPFFLLISGFTVTYAHIDPAPHFFFSRISLLYPLYIASLLLHAFFFSTSALPLRRALLSAAFLTPYLPSALAYPVTDVPFLATNLIPCLAICYLVFPTVIALFPRPARSASLSISITLATMYLMTVLQAFWLSHLPNTPSTHRSLMLIDIAAYVPFLADVPAFMLGILLALRRLSLPPPSESVSKARVIIPLAVFLIAAFLVSYILPTVAPMSFMEQFLFRSALLPPFALLVYNLSAFQSSNPHIMSHLSAFGYTVYASTVPVWHLLGRSFCRKEAPSTLRALCVKSAPSYTPIPSWLSWLPWFHEPTAASAAANRALQHTILLYPGAHPVVFLPVLLSVSVVVYFLFQAPLKAAIPLLFDRILQLWEDGRLGARIHALLTPRNVAPSRDNNVTERLVRVMIYYVACGGFLAFVYYFSRPISNELIAANPLSLFCWLPNFLYSCKEDDGAQGLQGLLGKFGIGAVIVTRAIDVIRWMICLTLPVMTFNVIGHTIFPRAIWRRLPTVSNMMNYKSSERQQSDSGSNTGVMKRFLGSGIGREEALTNELDFNFVLYIRYVTRGKNPHLVGENAARAARILAKSGLPRHMWRVEVVTDESVNLREQISDESVYEIVVPTSYRPENGALYKARALNYAISTSPARAHDWIVHLDEETRFEADTIRAILYHCGRESYLTYVAKSQKWPRIGQGPIIFGHAMVENEATGVGDGNWLTTLADSGRVSDDCGRYRVQFECGEVWVGMHGSFVIAANCVEMDVTFDHGAEGSIAEDAYFALLARSRDVRFAWVDALMFEQSPFTFMDFVKQRARWLVGGIRVVFSRRIPLRVRIIMMCLSTTWALMPMTYLVLLLSALFGSEDHGGDGDRLYFHILLPLLATFSLWNYAFGFFVTFSMRRVGVIKFLVLLYAQLVLSPLFGLMEVSSVSYALWNFKKLSVGFHVVQKERSTKENSNTGSGDQVDELTRLL